jgi:hypothetical protein
MNKQLALLCLGFFSTICLFSQRSSKRISRQIIIINTSSITLKDKPVSIKRSSITGIPAGNVYPVIMFQQDTIPAQVDDIDDDNKWDELFFVINLKAKQKKTLFLKWVLNEPLFTKRTSVRFGKRMAANLPVQPATVETLTAKEIPKSLGFQRYQTDGPSWENDKVGFRHYLDGRNAKDVFGKLEPNMSPDNVGMNAKGEVEDNYHVMEKWGRDILAVGNSVGIGGVCLIKGDSLLRLGVTAEDTINNVEKTSFKIVTEGPTRSILNFKYHNWKPLQTTYVAEETVSIWPGMYAYHNSVKVKGLQGNEDLGIGIVNINAEKPPTVLKINNKFLALISHEKHAYNKIWWIGLALIVPAENYTGFIDAPKKGKLATSYIAKLKIKNNEPVNYYAVAGWELSKKGFSNASFFHNYVTNLTQQITALVKVVVR